MSYKFKRQQALSLISIFFLIILFSKVSNYQITKMTFSEFKEGIYNKQITEGISYEVSYSQEQITSNYLKILSKHENSDFYIYFSPKSNERKDAVLFNSEYKKDISLYINKEFLNSETNNFYLTISCFSNECSFSFSVSELNEINLSRNELYSYYAYDNKNTKTIFKIYRNKEEDSYITFWATGNKNTKMAIKYYYSADISESEITNINSLNHPNGQILVVNENNFRKSDSGDSYYIVEINSEKDTYITFGTKTSKINNDVKIYSYSINSKEMEGALSEDISSECYDFNLNSLSQNEKLYLNIIDYNKLINIEIKSIENKELIKTLNIPDGMTTFELASSEYSNKYICFSLINKKNINGFYSFQVINKSTKGNYLNLYSPQIEGYSYKRFLSPGESEFYSVLPKSDLGNEFKYNLKVISGYPKMYIIKCEEFPNCKLDVNNIPSNAINPQNINDIYSYSLFSRNMNKIISGEQYILYAYCQNNDNNQCIFETNIFSDKDIIYLKENESFYNKISENGKDIYAIKLNNFNFDNPNNFIIINFISFNGDISINNSPINAYSIKNYLSGNKNFYIIKKEKDLQNNENNEVTFTVNGNSESYYTVYFNFINNSDNSILNSESGVSYIETIFPETGYKNIKIKNKKKLEQNNFITSFLSLNCEVSIKRIYNNNEKSIENINNFAQDILIRSEETKEEYDIGEYQYKIKLEKMLNVINYEQNYCMIYISSIEKNSNNDNDFKKKQLLIAEGTINQIKLSKNLNEVEYIYPHINKQGYVVLNFNLEIDSKINIDIEINNKHLTQFQISKSKYYIIQESVLRSESYCPINNNIPNIPCNIKTKLTLDEKFYLDEPIIKFNIKSKEIFPNYISKIFLSQDIVVSNYYQYYYIELGKKEEGEVIINFKRGSGKAYSRIITKDSNEGQGWMNKFILPEEKNNEIIFDIYTKSIVYTKEMTDKCDIGCYLLIKVITNLNEDNINMKNENIAFPITIAAHSNEPNNKNINLVNFPLNEYIFGNTNNDFIKKYYTFFIPNDYDEIIFELETEVCKLLVNIGDRKATISFDFNFYKLGVDSVYRITKEKINEILKKESISSIKNVKLNIAVSTEYIEDFYTSLYSFRIIGSKKNQLEIIQLNNDQKTVCDIKGSKGNCYYLLTQNKIINNLNNNIFFYALEENEVEFKYYADIIEKNIIDENNQDEIKNKITSSKNNPKWSNEKTKKNYLYIDKKELQKYFDENDEIYILLNIEMNSLKSENDVTIINLIHTLYSYTGLILPNPTTMQLFSITDNPIRFRFPKNEIKAKNTRVHIINVLGNGYIINENNINEKYYLKNPAESIDISLDINNVGENTILKVINSNTNQIFGFYLYYEVDSPEENFNELDYGRQTEIIYKNTDFPFILISKLVDKKNIVDVEIKVNIKNELKSEIISETELFDISGVITDEIMIYSKKSNSHKNPSFNNKLNGKYDPVSKIGRIQFTQSQIEEFNINSINYIYIIITKSSNNKKIYNDVSLDVIVLPSNKNGYYAPINKYIEGKIPFNYEGYIRYELNRIETKNKYIRIEFGTNTDKISYAINFNKNNNENINFYKNSTSFDFSEYKDGKSVIILKMDTDDIISIYLSIFNNENEQHKNNEKDLSNFVFKYELGENKEVFSKKYLKENTIKYEYKKDSNKIQLNIPQIYIGENKDFIIDYYIKLVSADELTKDEKIDTISQIQSNSIKIYKKSVLSKGEEQQIELNDIKEDTIYYLVVLVKINDEKTSEFFSFKNIYNPSNQINKDDNNKKENYTDNKKIIITIIIIIVAIVLFVIICYFIYLRTKKTNELLMNKINSLSFIQPQEEGIIQ